MGRGRPRLKAAYGCQFVIFSSILHGAPAPGKEADTALVRPS